MTEYLLQFIVLLTWALYIALIGRVIISWIQLDPNNPIVTIIYQITEPILAPIRRVLPKMGMLDLSPMVAIIIIFAVRELFQILL